MEGEIFESTFLPEVAEEQGWDQETTLEYLVEKSGWQYGLKKVKKLI